MLIIITNCFFYLFKASNEEEHYEIMSEIRHYKSKQEICIKAREIDERQLQKMILNQEKEKEKQRQQELNSALHPGDEPLTSEDRQMLSQVAAMEQESESSSSSAGSPTALLAKQTQVISGFKGKVFY